VKGGIELLSGYRTEISRRALGRKGAVVALAAVVFFAEAPLFSAVPTGGDRPRARNGRLSRSLE